MTNQPQGTPTEKSGPPFDRWVGLVLLGVSGILLYETFFFRSFDWDPVGMAFWPRVLLAVLGAVSVWHVVAGRAGGGTMEPLSRRAFILFGGAMAYVAALPTVGFLILTPIAIFVYSLWLRPFSRRAVLGAALLAVVGTASIHALFLYGMSVYLPQGFLE